VTGLHPAPGPARAWLERELSRPAYHQSLLQRLLHWLDSVWERLSARALGASHLSTAAAVVLTVVLVALVLAAVSRARRNPSAARDDHGAVSVADVSADEHRVRALRALDEGDAASALVEGFRALAARSVARGLVAARPGLTARELVTELAPRFPDHQGALVEAASRFDQVFYGDRPVTEQAAADVLDLEECLRQAWPLAGLPSDSAVAVPR
jgi:hypothetical protein